MYSSQFSPPINKRTGPKDSFQQELDRKMKDRHTKGLSAQISDGEDELASDDELLGNFNMTSKVGRKGETWGGGQKSKYDQSSHRSPFSSDPGRKSDLRNSPYGDSAFSPRTKDHRRSPHQEDKASALDTIFGRSRKTPTYDDDDDEQDFGGGDLMMKTMRQPLKPNWASSDKGKAPNPKPRKGTSSGALLEGRSPREQQRWEPPSFRKASPQREAQDNKENRRSKSPGLFSRELSGHSLDAIGEDEDGEHQYRGTRERGMRPDDRKPKVTPRKLTPRDSLKKGDSREEDHKEEPNFKRRSPTTNIFGSGRKTPTQYDDESRKGKKSPTPAARFGKDKDGRKTPTGGKLRSKSPADEKREEGARKASILDYMADSSPKDKSKKGGPKLLLDSDSDEGETKRKGIPRRTGSNERNPFGDRRDQRPSDRKQRKSPSDEYTRRSPFADQEGRGRKSPVDTWDRKSPHNRLRDDDDRRKSPFERSEDKRYTRDSPLEKSREDRYKQERKSSFEREKDSDRHRDRRSPYGKERGDSYERDRKSPFEKKKEDREDGRRKSPFGSEARSSRYEKDEKDRRSPYDKRYRDDDRDDHRKNPLDQKWDCYDRRLRDGSDDRDGAGRGRRSRDSFDEGDGRDPWKDDHRPTLKWKDQEEARQYDDRYRRERMEERDHRRQEERERNRSPWSEDRPPSLHKHQRGWSGTDEDLRSRSRTKSPALERDSSYCEELDREPEERRPKKEESPQAEERKRKPAARTTEKRVLETAIDTIEDAQKDNRMKYIEPADKEDKKKAEVEQKQSKVRPKPRYGVLPGEQKEEIPKSFNRTTDIRSAVYDSWLQERTKQKKKELIEKKKLEKEEEEKKKKGEEEKYLEAKASYKVWKEKKDEQLKEVLRKKREEEQKKREKEVEEKTEKKKEADVTFRTWKENKDVCIKEKQRREKREEQEKKEEEEDDKARKKRDAARTYMRWKEKKDHQSIQNKTREVQSAKEKEREEKRAQRQRERDAEERYEKWLMKKERQDQQTLKRSCSHTDIEPPPAWYPSGRTIPFRR